MPTTRDARKKGPAPIALVTWMDACSRPSEVNDVRKDLPDEILGCVQNTVGYLIRNDRKWVVLAADWGYNGTYRDTFEIPKSLVQKIRRLKHLSKA